MDTKDIFLREGGRELAAGNLAIFAGAGLSVGAGFVNWRELLRPIADELGLEVEKESDLVAVAQYHCNANGNNRSQLNQRLIEEFKKQAEITENHAILARLPVATYWTTNYDQLIEDALRQRGKKVDVKYTRNHLTQSMATRDAVVYKMHGDADHPDQAILTRDDYEKYHVQMEPYLTALKADLSAKTFLFLGFSFSDPNIDQILSRVRVAYESSQRRHYCLLARVAPAPQMSEADFRYQQRRQDLFIDDLKRFNIMTILVDRYAEIPELLSRLEVAYRRKTIFISGAAHDFGGLSDGPASLAFIHALSREIIKQGLRIVSGFGLGVGSAVITGALEQIYQQGGQSVGRQLILRPFPQHLQDASQRQALWRQYRVDMIAEAGIAIFLFGNKLAPTTGAAEETSKIVASSGMEEEYRIAKENGLVTIPVGVTGWVARDVWEQEKRLLEEFCRADLSKSADPAAWEDHARLSPDLKLFQTLAVPERQRYTMLFHQLGEERDLQRLQSVILEMIRIVSSCQ
jgi:hypothetical protein